MSKIQWLLNIWIVIFTKIHKRDKRGNKVKWNGNGVRMSLCCNVLLTKKENDVLFKNFILILLQSICADDGKLIRKVCKPSKCPPPQKNLNFCIATTPTPLSQISIVWPTSFPTLLQHLTFHADWSYQTKVSVGERGCSKVGNVTLKKLFHRF